MRSRRLLTVLTGLAVLAGALPALASPPPDGPPGQVKKACTDKTLGVSPLDLTVGGENAHGLYALPDKAPKTLLVFAHGYGHTSVSWIKHMEIAANDHGVAAVTMDYRGLQITAGQNGSRPTSRGWNALKGAEDLVAAGQHFERLCPTIENIHIFGVSMGANMSGLAVAMQPKRSDGSPLWDYWFDIEGAVNVVETYLAARAVAPALPFAANAQQDIEAEMGGPIEEKYETYLDRAVVTHVDDIKASGIKGVVLVHGLDDGLVPYNQSREMSSLLLQAGVALDFYTVGRRDSDSEPETTATGHVLGQVQPGYVSPFAGHASESSTTHTIMETAFDRLWSLIEEGEEPGLYREFFVDGDSDPVGTP